MVCCGDFGWRNQHRFYETGVAVKGQVFLMAPCVDDIEALDFLHLVCVLGFAMHSIDDLDVIQAAVTAVQSEVDSFFVQACRVAVLDVVFNGFGDHVKVTSSR